MLVVRARLGSQGTHLYPCLDDILMRNLTQPTARDANSGPPASPQLCNRHQEKFLDPIGKDNPPGSGQRQLSGKDLPITQQVPEDPGTHLCPAQVHQTNHSSVLPSTEPPGIMHRGHSGGHKACYMHSHPFLVGKVIQKIKR